MRLYPIIVHYLLLLSNIFFPPLFCKTKKFFKKYPVRRLSILLAEHKCTHKVCRRFHWKSRFVWFNVEERLVFTFMSWRVDGSFYILRSVVVNDLSILQRTRTRTNTFRNDKYVRNVPFRRFIVIDSAMGTWTRIVFIDNEFCIEIRI